MAQPRITRVIGAVNPGSFRISAMIMGLSEDGELVVMGSGHRASQGIKRGYVTDMAAASYAIRDAVERAEKNAGASVQSVWVGCAGAGLDSRVSKVEIEIGGRRVEEEDIQALLLAARDTIQPDGRMILHAQPAHYTLDGAHGVVNPRGLHAERLGVDIHIMLADGAPVRNLSEAVQNAHLDVEAVVATPLAAGYACLSAEERDLGVALVEVGADITNVALYAGGKLLGMTALPFGSGDITDAIASTFGIRRFEAERLKCVAGSAIASPADHREMIQIGGASEDPAGPGNSAERSIARAELVSIITQNLAHLTREIGRALKEMGFTGTQGGQVVLSGGGAELAGLAEYVQAALGRPCRIGRPLPMRGLPEAHATPGFSCLLGLCLYAADDPVDIRMIGKNHQISLRYSAPQSVARLLSALREYF